jgi:hypothetical protein
MADKIALSIENVLRRKVDPIRMKWIENDGMDSQEHPEHTDRANVLKEIPKDPEDTQEDEPPTLDLINMKSQEDGGIDSQNHIEITHGNSASNCTTVDNNLNSNIMEKSDIDNSVDKDSISDEKTPTDGTETSRSSNRTRKFPASRYSDFLWDS